MMVMNYRRRNRAIVRAANINGSCRLARGAQLTGATNSILGTFVVWLRLDINGDGVQSHIFSPASALAGTTARGLRLRKDAGNTFTVLGTDAGSTTVLSVSTTTTYTGSSTWLCIMGSFDLSNSSKRHLYINDVNKLQTITTYTNTAIGNQQPDFGVGDLPGGTTPFFGRMAELWYAPGVYIDFSVEENRRMFITGNLDPTYLGSNGELPTGTSPLVYLRLLSTDPVNSFILNRGTGGDLSVASGALQLSDSSPSD